MQPRLAIKVFARRLLVGWALSWFILLINTYDVGTISFIFSDSSIAFFALGTGPLIALFSSWHMLLPTRSRMAAIVATIIVVYLLGFLTFGIDLSRREELDGLITLFVIGPQIILLALGVTVFDIKDALALKKNNF